MPRKPRSIKGNEIYHVMNRAAARVQMFFKDEDYTAFEAVLAQAVARFEMRLLTYVLMPNHFHLVLWPRLGQEKTLSRFMQWLQQTHTQRWHAHFRNAGTGRLYQGRFKAFAIQRGEWVYLRRVCRYVDRNPLRANLVPTADAWRWGALWRRLQGNADERKWLTSWPGDAYPGDTAWLKLVNTAMARPEEDAVRTSMVRGRPYGEERWVARAASAMGLEHTLRRPGRPRKRAQPKEALILRNDV